MIKSAGLVNFITFVMIIIILTSTVKSCDPYRSKTQDSNTCKQNNDILCQKACESEDMKPGFINKTKQKKIKYGKCITFRTGARVCACTICEGGFSLLPPDGSLKEN